MSKKYIALKAIQSKDAEGRIVSIEPKSETHSGLFTADYTEAQEARLRDLGAIREPEGVETHEKITGMTVEDRREQLADTAEPIAPKVVGGKGGGRKPKADDPKAVEGESQAPEGSDAGLLE